MGDAAVPSETSAGELGFEAYGVRGSLSASPDALLARARSLLPPGWRSCARTSAAGRFSLVQLDGGYEVRVNDVSHARTSEVEVALGVLDAEIRAHVALRAPERIFVHAGVVADDGAAILIPGRSFSGKTTLVAALIAAGATYCSDEYAVLDERGLVHPYPRSLSIRDDPTGRTEDPVVDLAGAAASQPLSAGLIVLTSYRPGASWRPQRQSPATGAMALLSNTVPARDRPAQAMAAVRRAATAALVLEGERGEATEMASDLIDALRCRRPGPDPPAS